MSETVTCVVNALKCQGGLGKIHGELRPHVRGFFWRVRRGGVTVTRGGSLRLPHHSKDTGAAGP